MKTPTIFFGSSSYVLPIIEMLSGNYDLRLVITTEKERGAVPAYCQINNIPWITLSSFKDKVWENHIANDLKKWSVEFAILADFALFIPSRVLDVFPKGIINIHPSLLPKYRGATPGTSAIFYGEEVTGVSIMLLDTKLDHGPLLGQVSEHILPSDTSASLYPRLFTIGTQLLEETLPQYLNGALYPKEQDHSQATYSLEHLTRDSGFIDLNKPPIPPLQQLERMIRAYFPWPGVWTKARIKNQEVRIKLLPEKMVQIEGKKPVSYKDFINGYTEGKEILGKLGLS